MIHARKSSCERIDFTIRKRNKVVARASLVFIKNELHKRPSGMRIPYALLEDVFVENRYRGRGYAAELLNKAIEQAKAHRCYKLIAIVDSTQPNLVKLYNKAGLIQNNTEFRIDLMNPGR